MASTRPRSSIGEARGDPLKPSSSPPCGGFPNLLRRLGSQASSALEWVDWFNHRRLLESIGNMPPAEAEARYYAELETLAMAA